MKVISQPCQKAKIRILQKLANAFAVQLKKHQELRTESYLGPSQTSMMEFYLRKQLTASA